jgi:hypothetical protein
MRKNVPTGRGCHVGEEYWSADTICSVNSVAQSTRGIEIPGSPIQKKSVCLREFKIMDL